MFVKEFLIGLFLVYILSGCTTQKKVSLKEKQTLVYTPMHLPDADDTIESKEDPMEKEIIENEQKEEELSDFQKHMLYIDYKLKK